MPSIPISLARKIASYAKGNTGARVLDCQCGEGNALRLLGQQWECATYGLDDPLPGLAGIGITQTLRGTLDSVKVSDGSMSAVLVWLPDDSRSLREREPTALVQRAAEVCAYHGVLVFIGSPVVFDQGLLTAALRRMEDVLLARAWPWAPDLILMGRRADAGGSVRAKDLLDQIARGAGPVLEEGASPRYELPAVSGQLIFSPTTLSYADALEAARREGIWTQSKFASVLYRKATRQLQPAMPLRRGHLGLLVAAGAFGTLLVRRGNQRLLLRGRTYKRTYEAGDAGRGGRIATEVFATDAAVLDLGAGTFHLLRESADTHPEAPS